MILTEFITFEDTFGRSIFLNPKQIVAVCRENNGKVAIYTTSTSFHTDMDIQDVLSQLNCEINEPKFPKFLTQSCPGDL